MPHGHILYMGGKYFYTLMRNKRNILQSFNVIVIRAMIDANITLPSWYIQ
jgi:hypothetical protein